MSTLNTRTEVRTQTTACTEHRLVITRKDLEEFFKLRELEGFAMSFEYIDADGDPCESSLHKEAPIVFRFVKTTQTQETIETGSVSI